MAIDNFKFKYIYTSFQTYRHTPHYNGRGLDWFICQFIHVKVLAQSAFNQKQHVHAFPRRRDLPQNDVASGRVARKRLLKLLLEVSAMDANNFGEWEWEREGRIASNLVKRRRTE